MVSRTHDTDFASAGEGPGSLVRYQGLELGPSCGQEGMGMETVSQRLDPERHSSESQRFEKELRRRIVGQEEGVRALVDLYQVFCAGMCPQGRPVGSLLFLGPTGSGKTRIVEAAAEILFGDPRAVIKVDCAANESPKTPNPRETNAANRSGVHNSEGGSGDWFADPPKGHTF